MVFKVVGCVFSSKRDACSGPSAGCVYDSTFTKPEDYIFSPALGCEFASFGGRTAVLRALAGKHIVMIGDSVVRYQYRALVYALHHGHTMVKGKGAATRGVYMSSETWEREWSAWMSFFGQLHDDFGSAEMQCDCFRLPLSMEGSFENMYYFNREYNLNITFFLHNTCVVGGHVPLGWKEDFVSTGDAPATADASFNCTSLSTLGDLILQGMGQVDEVLVNVGGAWDKPKDSVLAGGSIVDYMRGIEKVVKGSCSGSGSDSGSNSSNISSGSNYISISSTNSNSGNSSSTGSGELAASMEGTAVAEQRECRKPIFVTNSAGVEDSPEGHKKKVMATADYLEHARTLGWGVFNRLAVVDSVIMDFVKKDWKFSHMNQDVHHFNGHVYDKINQAMLRVLLRRGAEVSRASSQLLVLLF
jgi:hypothetical protein